MTDTKLLEADTAADPCTACYNKPHNSNPDLKIHTRTHAHMRTRKHARTHVSIAGIQLPNYKLLQNNCSVLCR